MHPAFRPVSVHSRSLFSLPAMAAEAFARRAALLGVVHFLIACLVPTLPPESVGYHRALVGAHVNSVTLAAMQASRSKRGDFPPAQYRPLVLLLRRRFRFAARASNP